MENTCIVCGKSFKADRRHYKYCSKQCCKYAHCPPDSERGISKGTIGAIHELQVSVDLLRLGWEVFRAVSPNASCDLIACKGDRAVKVQVTKARISPITGNVSYDSHDGENFDVLAISYVDGKIRYMPSLA